MFFSWASIFLCFTGGDTYHWSFVLDWPHGLGVYTLFCIIAVLFLLLREYWNGTRRDGIKPQGKLNQSTCIHTSLTI